MLVRPRRFRPNPQTASDNVFQSLDASRDADVLAASAYREVTALADALTALGVTVHLFDDDDEQRPDSVFPNNWFSTHSGGRVALFPMFAPNRRTERRGDIVEMLKREYRVQDVVDYSGLEYDDIFLEGTGAMVLDHVSRLAYVSRSFRADPLALERFCTHFGYEPMAFDAVDDSGFPIYHTNVMMCIATEFALVGAASIVSPPRRDEVRERLAAPGRVVIELDAAQIRAFAGNAIELHGSAGRVLALSTRAHAALRPEQLEIIERSCTVLPVDVSTIELAGGSVRCMLAGIHLDPRRNAIPAGAAATVAVG